MVAVAAILAILVFIAWIIYRAVRGRQIKAYMISYGIACVAGVFTYAYFLSIDFPQLIKIVVSIVLGVILILIGALYQRRASIRSEN
jgi:hypothetical protein